MYSARHVKDQDSKRRCQTSKYSPFIGTFKHGETATDEKISLQLTWTSNTILYVVYFFSHIIWSVILRASPSRSALPIRMFFVWKSPGKCSLGYTKNKRWIAARMDCSKNHCLPLCLFNISYGAGSSRFTNMSRWGSHFFCFKSFFSLLGYFYIQFISLSLPESISLDISLDSSALSVWEMVSPEIKV